jgi:hypothetical protein
MINADIRKCAGIWRSRANELFGDLSAINDFNHALKCADRFEEQLKGNEPSLLKARFSR